MVNKLLSGAAMALALIGAVPASAQSGAGGSAAALAAYRINPGDELDIFVWGEERLQRSVRVLPDGTATARCEGGESDVCLALDGSAVGWTHGHGRHLTWC